MAVVKTGLIAGGMKIAYNAAVEITAEGTWDTSLSSVLFCGIANHGTVTTSMQGALFTWSNTTDATVVTVNTGTDAAMSVSLFAFGT